MAPEKEKIKSLAEQLGELSGDELRGVMAKAGIGPTTIGMSLEQMQLLLGTLGSTSATAMREAIKQQRRENPSYPEKSVFNPQGRFTDDGVAIDAKPKLRRHTKFCGVTVGKAGDIAELNTVEEVELINQFNEDRSARDGQWTATIEGKGTRKEVLLISLGSVRTIDERNGLPPMSHILAELLNGKEAVDPISMQKRLEAMQAEIDKLKSGTTVAA